MTPKEITTLAHHRLVPPWVIKLVLEATAIEREKALEEAANVCEQIDTAAFGSERPAPNDCAAAIRGLK